MQVHLIQMTMLNFTIPAIQLFQWMGGQFNMLVRLVQGCLVLM